MRAVDAHELDAEHARRGIADRHRVALEHQLAVDARKGRPRRGPVGLARHIGQRHVVGTRGDAELAARAGAGRGRRGKREVPQVALDAEAGAGHATVEHRLLHIATRRLRARPAADSAPRLQRGRATSCPSARAGPAGARRGHGRRRRRSRCGRGGPRAGLPACEADLALRIGIGEARVGDRPTRWPVARLHRRRRECARPAAPKTCRTPPRALRTCRAGSARPCRAAGGPCRRFRWRRSRSRRCASPAGRRLRPCAAGAAARVSPTMLALAW